MRLYIDNHSTHTELIVYGAWTGDRTEYVLPFLVPISATIIATDFD